MNWPREIRQALRMWRRAPSAAAIALGSTALGIAASTVVFVAVRSVLLTPLPYAEPDRLVQIGTEHPRIAEASRSDWVMWKDIQEVIRNTRTLESVGVSGNALFTLAGDRDHLPEALYGVRMSANLFPMLGVAPMLGRNLLPEEDLSANGGRILLSYGLWKRRFGGDRAIIGRAVKFDGHDMVIVGVMPEGFDYPLRRPTHVRTPSPYTEFWASLPADIVASRGAMSAVGRLRSGVSVGTARAELRSIAASFAKTVPEGERDRTLRVNPLAERVYGSARPALWLLMGMAVLFMGIACANVANLLLARGEARRREMSIRVAIGASPARIVRQLLMESGVLALGGGLAGFLLVAAAWKVLPAVVPVNIPRLGSAQADLTALGFAVAAALVNGVVFGLTPALRALRQERLGFARQVPGRGLIVAQIAIAMLLVALGTQLLASFVRLAQRDPGFDAEGVVASVIPPAGDRYRDPAQQGLLFQRILERVRALPGVESAGTVDALPFSGENHGGFVSAREENVVTDQGRLVAEVDVVSSGYLETMRARLLAGRWFRPEESAGSSDVAIVSDVLAERLWPRQSALGKAICVHCAADHPRDWKRVIGVVGAMRHAKLDESGASVFVGSHALEHSIFLVVRTARPAGEMAQEIRRAVAAVDPNQPVFLSATMSSMIGDSIADRRFVMALLAALATLALALAAGGVYGVMSYATSRRAREMGIRMAIGATGGDLVAMVFGQAFRVIAAGMLFGIATAVVLTRLLAGKLSGLESPDHGQVVGAAIIVALAAGIACWLPARRTMRTDPVSALRQE